MRKAILMMLLAVVSSSAIASDWVFIDSAGDKGTSFIEYADNDSIRRNGAIVKIWVMADDKYTEKTQGKKYRSIKSQWEIDCKSEQMHVVFTTFFSGNMGNGEPVLTDTKFTELRPVSPDSVGESLFRFACGKK